MDDFSDLASLIHLPQKPTGKNVTAQTWLNDFTDWIENGYSEAVHHPRAPGLHASQLGLSQPCARRVMLEALIKPDPERMAAGQIMTFDLGHTMHWWWQHRYLGPKQELWGDWHCNHCDTTTLGFMPLNCKCGSDWRDSIHYKELKVVDEELGYVGHSDGILVDKKSSKRRIFEFKSCSDYEFVKIRQPKLSHIIQAHAYMRKLGPTEALIVYQNKGKQCKWIPDGAGMIPGEVFVKPYVVSYDSDVWSEVESRIKAHKSALKELQTILDEGKQVTKSNVESKTRICLTNESEPAKYCPVRDACFLMNSPPIKPKFLEEGFDIQS